MTSSSLYPRNRIAVIWDFDKTLIRGHMQAPLFAHFGVDEETFWQEANGYAEFFRTRGLSNFSSDTYYLQHILTYVRAGKFAGLNNALLRELGKELPFFPGVPEFFNVLAQQVRKEPNFKRLGIELEHYIVSSGLRETIVGSTIGPLVTEVYACEFVEELPYPGYLSAPAQTTLDQAGERVIQAVGYQIDDTSKTRAIFEINKGREFNVNDKVPYEARRIPFENMIYIADGKSDVPVFSVLNQYGGRTFAVYDGLKGFREANELLRQKRVDCIGPADYTAGSLAYYWISEAVQDIALRIERDWTRALNEKVGRAPSYRTDRESAPTALVTQESVVADLQDAQPLFTLPAPPSASTARDEPPSLVEALGHVSARYQPVTDEERRHLGSWVRNRSAARSEGGRRRGSAEDRLAVTPAEVEAELDALRARPRSN